MEKREQSVASVVRMALMIPPMGEQSIALDFAAAAGALRSRGRVGTRRGEPSDHDSADSLEKLWKRISDVLDAS